MFLETLIYLQTPIKAESDFLDFFFYTSTFLCLCSHNVCNRNLEYSIPVWQVDLKKYKQEMKKKLDPEQHRKLTLLFTMLTFLFSSAADNKVLSFYSGQHSLTVHFIVSLKRQSG